jgi:hypothetical protein
MGALLLATLLTSGSSADPEHSEATLNPIAIENLLRLEPTYKNLAAGGNETDALLRATVAYRDFVIPGLLPSDQFYSVFRFDAPFASKNMSAEMSAGLQDVTALEALCHGFSWIDVGVGLSMTFPTARASALGDGKYQLAPTLGAVVRTVPHWRFAFLAQNFFSVAGDASRPSLNYLSFQVIVGGHLTDGFLLTSDPTMKFDWLKGGAATIPVNLQAGYEFGNRMTILLGPEWVITGSGRHDLSVLLKVDYQGW